MKKFWLYLGIIICLFGLFPFLRYIFDFQVLSNYGKGFILGKVLIIVIGLSMIFIGSGVLKRTK
jgi:hypothetical protein